MLQGIVFALVIGMAACERPTPLYPAKGRVLFEGKPIPKAVVWLQPDTDEPTKHRPRGDVDADGYFELSSEKPGDGAPAGRYRATVFWYQNWTKPAERGDDLGANLLPPRYQNAQKAGLPIVEIKAEPNVIPTFELKR